MFRSPARLIAAATTLLLIPQTVLAQDFTSGLIGHWRLDETSGTTASDGSGDGYNGTMTGGLSGTNTVTGQINTGLTFDGTDDEIVVTGRMGSPTNITVSAWARLTSRGGLGGELFTIGDDLTLRLDNRDGAAGTKGIFYNNPAGWQSTNSGTDYIGTGWHHFTYVFNDTGNIQTLYVDGTAVATTNYTQSITYQHGANVHIGQHGNGAANYDFGGDIDDVRLYNRALSAADVAALYTHEGYTCSNPNGETGNIIFNNSLRTLQYCNATQWVGIGPSKNLTQNLVAHWRMDNTSGTTATDSEGTNTGSMLGGMNASTASITGQIDTGFNFDGNNNYISAGSDTSIDDIFSGGGTISAWIYPESSGEGSYGRVIEKGETNGNNGWHLHMDGNRGQAISLSFGCSGGGFVWWRTNTSTVPDNQWSHVALVFNADSISNTPIFYINGSPVAFTTAGPCATGFASDAARTVYIGNRSDFARGFDGIIDDLRLYSRTLSQAEVQNLYALRPSCNVTTSGLVGHWNMNETTGATITDASGNANNGAWTDGVNNNVAEETLAGQDSTALSFDETNNVVTVPHAASLDISTGYTVSSWVWFDSTAAASPITASLIAKNDGGGWGHGWLVGRVSGGGNIVGGNIRLAVQHDRNISSPNAHYSGWIYPVDTWNYVTVSWDGTNVRYYLNGALIETGTLTAAPNTATGALHIGYGRANWYTTYHAGRIDDMRLYNRALSDDEIASLYGSLGGTCSVASCGSPYGAIGTITYNTTHHVMQYCDGTNWIAMNRAGNGGGGCSNPTGTAGSLVYNSTYNALQYCEGDQWMGAGSANNILTSGLIGHWKLDETSGTTAVDSSDGGYNGTMTGGLSGADTATGQLNTALTFDGTNTTGLLANTQSNMNTFTACTWVNPNSLTNAESDSQIYLFNKGWYIRFVGTGIVTFTISTSNVYPTVSSTTALTAGQWHHVCGVFYGIGTNPDLYINGALSSTSQGGGNGSLSDNSATNLSLGYSSNDYWGNLNGRMDDVRIYNRALSATEISNLYNSY